MFSGHSLPAKQRVSLVAFLSALVGRGGARCELVLLVSFFFGGKSRSGFRWKEESDGTGALL